VKRLRLVIDISPELRRRIMRAAEQKDLSVNEYVGRILEEVIPRESNLLEVMRAHPGEVFDSVETLHQIREER